MRPPWLQVDMEFVEAKAGDLGALLGISRREAVGLAVDLWSWVLKRSPDDAPPDGIVRDSRTGTGAVPMLERAGEWTGPEGKLAAALEEVGLLERLPDGIRLRGIERYATTWKKNRGGGGTAPESKRNRAGIETEPAPKMKRKIENKEDPPNPPLGGGDSQNLEVPQAPPQPQPGQPWTLQDAVDAVHRLVKKRTYLWDPRTDKGASRTLTGYCVAAGLDPVQEIARRFGRALERSTWPFERAPGKAVTLRELARRECWEINADPPTRLEERRNNLTAVNEKVEVQYDPWAAVCAQQEAVHEH
jgi:hypothetical protein